MRWIELCQFFFFFFQKITGRELKYTALIGKPSEITYHHADYLLYQQAKTLGFSNVDTIYCIG
jgi:hypothetical protein